MAFAVRERPDAQLPVLEDLGVADHDLVAGGLVADVEPHPADEVLPEVDQGGAGRRGEDGGRGQRLGDPHRRAVGRDQASQVAVDHLDGVGASAGLGAEVGPLAVVEVVGQDAALAGGPRLSVPRTCTAPSEVVTSSWASNANRSPYRPRRPRNPSRPRYQPLPSSTSSSLPPSRSRSVTS